MKKNSRVMQIVIFCFCFAALLFSCEKAKSEERAAQEDDTVKVTFIELGSVNCVPCRMMQPVTEQLEKNFPMDVRVVFYDVWTDEDARYAEVYDIQAIPTQVFLDENGEEFYRHVGFFPYEQIVEVLEQQGVAH